MRFKFGSFEFEIGIAEMGVMASTLIVIVGILAIAFGD